MSTLTAVYTEEPHAPHSFDLEGVEPPPTPTDLFLASQAATDLFPGDRGILQVVFSARVSLAISGVITFKRRLENPPNALFFRSNNPQGPFERVVSRPISVPPAGGGTFTVQIDKNTDPGLFPGFFVFGIRNPKGNAQKFSVVITGAVVDGVPVALRNWATVLGTVSDMEHKTTILGT